MAEARSDKPLYVTVFLNGFVALVELISGIIFSSLALISDAAHNLTDFFAIFLTLISRIYGRKPPTLRHTYGFRRLEFFSAFFNAALLLVIMVLLFKESIVRILHPAEVPDQKVVITLGFVAFLVNFLSVIILHPHKKDDVNIKAAFIHLFQDAVVSLIVIVSALLYTFPFGKYADPVATIVISFLVIKSSFSILWETVTTLLEGVPPNVSILDIIDFVRKKYPEISLHHIHLWQNGPDEILLTGHIQFKENIRTDDIEKVFSHLKEKLEEKWKINHITFEPEFKGCGESDIISNGVHGSNNH